MSAATGTMTPLNKIERAHQMYRDGRHEEALGFYTEALSMAKTKAQKIALHSNRAACYLKLHRFNKAAEECTLVLELDQNHTGALMLRAQTLVTLKDYHAALFDVNRLIELNPSSDVYQNLHARLKTQLLLAPIPECEEESLVSELEEEEEYEHQVEDEEEEEYEHQVEDEEEEEDEEEPEQQKQEAVALAEQEIEVPRTIPIARASVSQAVVALPDQKPEVPKTTPVARAPVVALADQKTEVPRNIPISRAPISSQTQSIKNLPDLHSKGHKEIPKPKGHSKLDYSRWDQVEDDSSEEDDDDDEESLPQYRFRVRTVGVRPVK